MNLGEFEDISVELTNMKIDIAKLKCQTLAIENATMRHKVQLNSAKRRELKNQIRELRKQLQPELPF